MDRTAPVLVGRVDRALVITLNRPEAGNSVNEEVAGAIGDALESAESDPSVRVVVITGAGDRFFCAGADLKALGRGESVFAKKNEGWGFAGYVNHFISKPTIAAVNGLALGGGTEIALASDLVVASESAMFGLPEVSRGIIAAAGGLVRLPAQIPHKIAMWMILSGDPVDAATAERWGLVNRMVPHGETLNAAMRLAERLVRNAPLALAASKRVALGYDGQSCSEEADRWELNEREAAYIQGTEDAREGPRAFVEKRTPRWQGR